MLVAGKPGLIRFKPHAAEGRSACLVANHQVLAVPQGLGLSQEMASTLDTSEVHKLQQRLSIPS
jgi:hypothetical protein